MRKILTAITLIICCANMVGAQQKVPVFVSGTEGHKSYRIPAIVSLGNGDLLAFCEGRVNGSGDFGDINIVMKRSKDKGKTWTALSTIVDADDLQAGNPAPVVDRTDPAFPGGRVFLFYNTGNNHEGELRKGNGLREVWYKTSADGGLTWSEAVNITAETHRPNQPKINPAYQFKEDWRAYANTPGHAFQFFSGKYKGRMYVAANHSAGNPQPRSMDYKAHGFYTDDHGKTFHFSEVVNMPGGNESTAADLGHNKLMMNSRNQEGSVRARIVAISSNGGQSWDTAYFDRTLIDPVNEGSLLRIGTKKGKAVLAFCNAADIKRRDNLTLRISKDDGRTWTKNIVVDRSPESSKGDFTAYSDIVKISKHKIGVLYERDGYKQIVFSIIKW